MALTMTRTRTQTTLAKLAQKLGEVKGELAFIEAWMADTEAPVELARRQTLLIEQAQALVTTLHLFDPEMEVGQVATLESWRRAYCQHCATSLFKRRFLEALQPTK